MLRCPEPHTLTHLKRAYPQTQRPHTIKSAHILLPYIFYVYVAHTLSSHHFRRESIYVCMRFVCAITAFEQQHLSLCVAVEPRIMIICVAHMYVCVYECVAWLTELFQGDPIELD